MAVSPLPRNELIALRARDAEWFLGSMNFTKTATGVYKGFRGRVLEVGCGPIGFFEAVFDVQVTAIDPLMRAYPCWARWSRGLLTPWVVKEVG